MHLQRFRVLAEAPGQVGGDSNRSVTRTGKPLVAVVDAQPDDFGCVERRIELGFCVRELVDAQSLERDVLRVEPILGDRCAPEDRGDAVRHGDSSPRCKR